METIAFHRFRFGDDEKERQSGGFDSRMTGCRTAGAVFQ
jgi:hypothetical protein